MLFPAHTRPLAVALGLLLTACLTACGQDAAPSRADTQNQSIYVDKLLNDFGRQELDRSPETASRLGLKPPPNVRSYTGRIDDRSQAAFERAKLARLEAFERIARIDIERLPKQTAITLGVSKAALESVVEMSAYGHGQISLGFSRPYAADQLSGAYIDLPDMLINRQLIRNKEEAIAYVERLARVAGAIDDDGRRLLADADAGIVQPDFILERMSRLAAQLGGADVETHPILIAFQNLSTGAGGLTSDDRHNLGNTVRRLLGEDVIPAYRRFGEKLDGLAATAPSTPGIWTITNGDDYYASALHFYTGQSVTPNVLHEDGLAIVATLTTELDIALQEAGFPDGTIPERLAAINALPDQLFANTPEGRAALLETLSTRLQAARPLVSRVIKNAPNTNVLVAQVPDILSTNAPGGYYAAAPSDGTSPGIFYINLRDTNEWPAYSLPTLLYHEAIPGHHLESAITAELSELPILRQLIWLPVYGEGWALYAEDLANELGVYDDDPLGKVGYLQSLIFRAARLVTDTGIHYQRWSRERAVNYLVETTGQPRSAMETEVDRYTVWPGQAVSYMVGRQFIWKLRQRSQDALGTKFSLPAFHEAILANGPRPLAYIETDIDNWIAAELEKP